MTDGPMTPTTRLDTDVEVHVDDTWWPGTLEHWRQRDDRWEGWVRYSTGIGQTRIGWYGRMDIRPIARG